MSPAPLVTATASADYSLTPAISARPTRCRRPGPRIRQSRSSAHTTTHRAEADLNAYTKRFDIPACTTANHCFRKLNQDGATSPLPVPDPTGGCS